MPSDEQSFTIFIASPQDVARERDHVAREAQRRAAEYERELSLRVVAWEETDWDSMKHIQLQIDDPALADVVIVILAGRLGSPLDRHGDRFVGAISGWVAPPGTVWEYERAAAARAANGAWPRVHVFVRSTPVSNTIEYADLAAIHTDRAAVDDYVARWVREPKPYSDEMSFLGAVRNVLDETLAARFNEFAPTRRLSYSTTPFRGLEVFEPEHHDLLFGRTARTLALRDLCETRLAASKGWVLVTGPSGSGKSSIVRAGLLRELMPTSISRRYTIGRYVIVRPGSGRADDAIRQLASQLLSARDAPNHAGLPELADRKDDTGRSFDLASVEAALRTPDTARSLVGETLADLRTREAARTGRADTIVRLVVVVDQMEELAAGRDEAFVDALIAIGDHVDVLVVATIRVDHLEQLSNRSEELADLEGRLAERFDGESMFTIGPPTDDELEQIVIDRTNAAGIPFERGVELQPGDREVANDLPGLVLGDARRIRSLPMIELLLQRWWEIDRERGALSYETYVTLGGVGGAIGRVGDEVLRHNGYAVSIDGSVSDRDESSAPPTYGLGEYPRHATNRDAGDLKRTMVAMVTAEGGYAGRVWRKASIARSEVPTGVAPVIAGLEAARLLVSVEASRDDDDERIEYAHEQVLVSWPVLASWLESAQPDLAKLDQVRRARRTWEERGRSPDQLLRGALLVVALELCRGGAVLVDAGTQAFIDASRKERTRERTRRWVGRGVAVAAVSAVLVAGVVAFRSARATDRERTERTALELAATAQQLAGVQFDQAALLAIEAFQRSERPETVAALVETLTRNPELQGIIRAHSAPVTALDSTEDGSLFATGDTDGRIRIFDGAGVEQTMMTAGADAIRSVSFAREGNILVSADGRGRLRRWDVASGAEIGSAIAAHQGAARAVVLPTSPTIASVGHDGSVALWDLDSGTQLAELGEHGDQGLGIAVAADGSRLASVGRDGHLLAWSLRVDDGVVAVVGDPIDLDLGIELRAVDLDPTDPDRVVVAAQDGDVSLVDLTGGSRTSVAQLPQRAFTVAFAADGRELAAAGRDGRIVVLRIDRSMSEPRLLDAHTGDVEAVGFLPDGRLLSASRDATVMTWSLDGEAVTTSNVLDERAIDVRFLPDGRIAAVGPVGRTSWLAVVDGSRSELDEPVTAFAVSDGVAAVGTESGGVELHDLSSRHGLGSANDAGLLARREVAHDGVVTAIAVSSSGDEIVSVGSDGKIARWDGRSLNPIASAEIRVADDDPDASGASSSRPRLAGLRAVVLRDSDGAVFAIDDAGSLWTWTLSVDPQRLSDGTARARSLAVSSSGEELVVGTDQDQLQVWDLSEGTARLRVALPHDGPIDVVAVDESGRVAAVSRAADTVTMYELASGQSLGVIPVVGVDSAALTAGALATASERGVLVWDVDPTTLIQTACDFVGRNLSADEWDRFIDEPYEATCP